jgi:pimeloyl-ACP methyl ester carboxylesterase
VNREDRYNVFLGEGASKDLMSEDAVLVSQSSIKPPSPWLMALESRAPWEYGVALASFPLLRNAAKGDGHPVLVFPGLSANDLSTVFLRRFLKRQGFAPHGWEQGFNFGPKRGVLDRSLDRIHALFENYRQPVSLVGWSLGGVYARELAKLAPTVVRSVITLGTPFAGPPRATNAWRLYEFVSGHQPDADPGLQLLLKGAPPVPTTSIYSKTDGVVAWRASIQTPCKVNPHTENIEITASHVGMGMNPLALYAVADRLAQPHGQWQPFHREGMRSLFYPEPGR